MQKSFRIRYFYCVFEYILMKEGGKSDMTEYKDDFNEVIFSGETDDTEEPLGKISDTELKASYVLSVIFLILSAATALLMFLRPELAENTEIFIKKMTDADISGIIKEYREGIKNVFL